MNASSNSLTGNGLTATGSPAYPCEVENDHAPPEVASDADLRRLELLAADADLQAVVDAWRTLPDAVRAGVVALVRTSKG